MQRRDLAAALAAALLGGALPGARAAARTGTKGEPFQTLAAPAPVAAAGGRIEVLLFFSYACPHCRAWEPGLRQWAAQLPAEVALTRVPVPFLMNGAHLQRLFFSLQAMGRQALHERVFATLHDTEQPFFTPEEMAQALLPAAERARFLELFRSAAVTASLRQAGARMNAHGVESVPMLAVQGRYLTSPTLAGGGPAALRVADGLIARVRAGA